jgi:hypothetical protein
MESAARKCLAPEIVELNVGAPAAGVDAQPEALQRAIPVDALMLATRPHIGKRASGILS